MEWSNVYVPVKDLSLISAVRSGMVEDTGLPGENHRPSPSENIKGIIVLVSRKKQIPSLLYTTNDNKECLIMCLKMSQNFFNYK